MRNGLLVWLSQETTKGNERNNLQGGFDSFLYIQPLKLGGRERESFNFCMKKKVALFVSFCVEIERERSGEAI